MGAPMAELIWPMAKEWPIELIPKDLREFQESDVEMLLVNGTVDFSTPPTALDEARPYFHKAQMVLLPEFSHIGDVMTLQPKAFERLVTSYYDTGVADDFALCVPAAVLQAGHEPDRDGQAAGGGYGRSPSAAHPGRRVGGTPHSPAAGPSKVKRSRSESMRR